MLWLRQNQIKKKVIHLGSVTAVLAIYWVLPTFIHIMGECTGSGSGSGCAG